MWREVVVVELLLWSARGSDKEAISSLVQITIR